jgi:hypothetical protein
MKENRIMKRYFSMAILSAAAFLLAAGSAPAQGQAAAPPSGQKTLASTVGVYVFPTAGQAADQQSKDEGECYNWAVQQSGSDPFQVQKQSQQQQAQADAAKKQAANAGKGAGAKGAVGGAAAGALIGEIASDDAGKGAAYGAAAGAIAGRRKGRKAEEKATQQVEQQSQAVQQASQEQIDAFKKAFSVCLEAKKYMVKF